MKYKRRQTIAVLCLTPLLFIMFSCAELSEFLENSDQVRPLTESEVVSGLKEALQVGASRAADTASQPGGFLENADLFIMFPPEARRGENTLRDLGFNSLVDDFITTLNRAAEEASKQAAPVFRAAVREMTIQDGFEILRGEPNAATEYLRRTTSGELHTLFKPVIEDALAGTMATRHWNDIVTQYNRIPFVQPVETDLASYTTTRATNGLFMLLEEEERAIRKDPIKRTTDVLRRVFGHPSLAAE